MKVIACETIKVIIDDLNNNLFSILIDESQDFSIKEKMEVIFCYLEKKGSVIERFISIFHVANKFYVFKVNTRVIIEKVHFNLVKNSWTIIWLVIAFDEKYIVNSMTFVNVSYERLQNMREDGLSSLLDEVSLFYEKHGIDIINMDDTFMLHGKPSHNVKIASNFNHFFKLMYFIRWLINNFQSWIRDLHMWSELFIWVASLSPRDSFSAFDKEKSINLARFYPLEFSLIELTGLDN